MPRFHLPFRRHRRFRKRSNVRMTLLVIFITVTLLLVAPIYAIYKPPHFLIRHFQSRWPEVLWFVSTSKKILALTIDDAPSAYTRELMGILEANNSTATFFVIGSQVPGNEQTLVDLIRNGHELANHAMYDEPSRALSNVELSKQLKVVQAHIENAYVAADMMQPPQRYFRPGSGFFSTRMRENVAKAGYQIVLGNIYPHDPQIPYSWINAQHILSMSRPGGIIICHDRRSWTPPMLKHVLPQLRQKGYKITSLTQALQEANG